MLLMAFLAVTGLTACSDDDGPKDSVKEIRMQVLSETGIMYAWSDDKMEHPIECMLVESEDFPGETLRSVLMKSKVLPMSVDTSITSR